MKVPALSVTSALNRHQWRQPNQKVDWAEGEWETVIMTASAESLLWWQPADMEQDISKYAPLHTYLAKTQMKWDAKTVELALKWFEENKPFDNDRDNELLVNRIYNSQAQDDSVTAERGICRSNWMDSQWQWPRMSSQRYKHCHHSEKFPWWRIRRYVLTYWSCSTDWSFLPSEIWQLRQAYSKRWLPSHSPCSATKIRRWTRQTRQTFQRQARRP